MSNTMIRYRVGLADQPTVDAVGDLVNGHVSREARRATMISPAHEDEQRAMRAEVDALRVLVGRLVDKAVARGIVNPDELIDWLDVEDAHEATIVQPPAEAVAEFALRECNGDVDKATAELIRRGLS